MSFSVQSLNRAIFLALVETLNGIMKIMKIPALCTISVILLFDSTFKFKLFDCFCLHNYFVRTARFDRVEDPTIADSMTFGVFPRFQSRRPRGS